MSSSSDNCYCITRCKNSYDKIYGAGSMGDSLINNQYKAALEYVTYIPKDNTKKSLESAIQMRDRLPNHCLDQAKYHCIVTLLRYRMENMNKYSNTNTQDAIVD